MKNNLKVDSSVVLNSIHDNNFNIVDKNGVELVNNNSNFFIYLTNVNFKLDGGITGRYKGVAEDYMVDWGCKEVKYIHGVGWSSSDGRVVRTARMVIVKNDSSPVIIVENN